MLKEKTIKKYVKENNRREMKCQGECNHPLFACPRVSKNTKAPS